MKITNNIKLSENAKKKIRDPFILDPASTIHCDVCSKEITDIDKDLFHMTTLLDGIVNKHTHLCLYCYIENVQYVPVIKLKGK